MTAAIPTSNTPIAIDFPNTILRSELGADIALLLSFLKRAAYKFA